MEIEFIEPFKIAKFTTHNIRRNSDGSIDEATITYEIPPGRMDPTTGWIDYTPDSYYTPDSFEDAGVKEAISLAMVEWTPEVRAAYKAHVMETYVPPPTDTGATLSYDQIDTLLNEIITTDGTGS